MNIWKKFRICSTRNDRAARSSKASFVIVCAFCLPLLCSAQQNKLTVSPPSQITVQRGGTVNQTLKVTVAPGLHVNNDKPKDEFVIPLKLTWDTGALQAESVEYPKPEQIRVGNDDLTVFTGTFEIETRFRATAQAAAGETSAHGKLRYQACNNQMCFRPATIDISVPVLIK